MARMSENTVRESAFSSEIGTHALEYVVALHAPSRLRARVVQAHFPNAPHDMRWSLASSVRTRDQGQSRTTFAGYPAKLRADAREDEINANSAPCVLDMALNAPWYNAIILECESPSCALSGRACEPGRGWFVDLSFDPLETTQARAATTTPTPPSATAVTNNAPVSVVVSVSQSASRTFPCPYCASPYAYASQAGLRRHITNSH
jgi:hypothetical protein